MCIPSTWWVLVQGSHHLCRHHLSHRQTRSASAGKSPANDSTIISLVYAINMSDLISQVWTLKRDTMLCHSCQICNTHLLRVIFWKQETFLCISHCYNTASNTCYNNMLFIHCYDLSLWSVQITEEYNRFHQESAHICCAFFFLKQVSLIKIYQQFSILHTKQQ